jgi:hypothetical protein
VNCEHLNSILLSAVNVPKKLKIARSLYSGLRNLTVEQPAPDFRQRVFAEVRRQHADKPGPSHGFRFAAGFATAALAGMAIWFVSSVYIPESMIEQPQMISVSVNKAQTVRLVFDSQTDIQLVNLSIDLPENVELDGYPGRKELSWNTSLKKGPNILALPILAIGQGQGELLAHLSYGDKSKEFRIVLKTVAEDSQGSG